MGEVKSNDSKVKAVEARATHEESLSQLTKTENTHEISDESDEMSLNSYKQEESTEE